jgi:hypothetical protein
MGEDATWWYEWLGERCRRRKWLIASNLRCCRILFVVGDVDERPLGGANEYGAAIGQTINRALTLTGV